MLLKVLGGVLTEPSTPIGNGSSTPFKVLDNPRAANAGRPSLGAEPGQILGLVLRRGLGLTLFGLALGRLMATMLYGVPAHDPATLAVVAALLVTVSFLACLHPALRATRVAPTEALREE